MAIEINNILFPSKKKAEEFIISLRDNHATGQKIKNSAHFFLLDLIKLHPNAKGKIGIGIDYFTVEIDPTFKSRHFMIHRIDRSKVDFSFRACLASPTDATILTKAARNEIYEQIKEFKYSKLDNGLILCPLNKLVLDKDNSHVDHIIPFKYIFYSWIGISRIDRLKIKISCQDNATRFLCRETAGYWQEYHLKNAELQLISIEAHKIRHAKNG